MMNNRFNKSSSSRLHRISRDKLNNITELKVQKVLNQLLHYIDNKFYTHLVEIPTTTTFLIKLHQKSKNNNKNTNNT